MNIFNWLKSAFSIKGRMRGDSFRSYRCNQCNRMEQKLREKKILENAPKVVAVGGGTGLSVLLRGLKKYTSNITAIVTVADDGGGSGVLREDLGMLPPGDIRNCILALADTEPIMEQLLQYRFQEGTLKGQSFGNLLIAAMNGISDSFEEAIRKISDVLAVTGEVLPVTLEDVILYAKLKNGVIVKGESQIPQKVKELRSGIEEVFLHPEDAKPLEEAVEAIHRADVVILGPGSLYTSVMPNLLVADISKAIKESKALKVYAANVMTQPGETDGYGVWQHVQAIIHHMKGNAIDYVFVNNEEIPQEILRKYAVDGSKPIYLTPKDRRILMKKGIQIVEAPLIDIKKHYIRHNAYRLSEMIINLVSERKNACSKKENFFSASSKKREKRSS
ncbi:MAG TPA: YvcK family protein [Clostridiales bacterium]|nr:YvcK family protein [Clostridiales bacterium]